jgi:hypothetical protein
MTLPAHRFEDRKKNDDGPKTFVFDFDETITSAPDRLARIATALKAQGDRVVVLTGSVLPRKDLIKRLNDYGFPFDDLIQYEDPGTDGIARSKYLEQLDAWCAFDDRAGRAYTYAKVCPVLYLISKPTDESKDSAKGSGKVAKKAVDKLKGPDAWRGAVAG